MPRCCAAAIASLIAIAIFSSVRQRQPAARNHVGQRFPFHHFHRQERRAVRFFDRVDRDDVGVIQRGDRLSFALEAQPPLRIARQKARQDLQRDAAVKAGIFGGIDLSHAAFPDRFEDAVMAERALERHRGHST